MTTMTQGSAGQLGNRPLAMQLKEETARAHETAEGSDYMTLLLKGVLSLEAVAGLTAQLFFVYEALEESVRNVAHTPEGAAVADPRLERCAALASDLRYFMGDEWRAKISPSEATRAYVRRLREINSDDNAHRVVAHHYVRYLGDISGGQIIASRLGTLYGIEKDGLGFYDFSDIGKIPPYRNAYRDRLNALDLNDERCAELVGEAQLAFRLNTALFADLHRVYVAG